MYIGRQNAARPGGTRLQRTAHRCPHCEQPVLISGDMWGSYYLCEDCGWTAEDDDDLATRPARRAIVPPFGDGASSGPSFRVT